MRSDEITERRAGNDLPDSNMNTLPVLQDEGHEAHRLTARQEVGKKYDNFALRSSISGKTENKSKTFWSFVESSLRFCVLCFHLRIGHEKSVKMRNNGLFRSSCEYSPRFNFN